MGQVLHGSAATAVGATGFRPAQGNGNMSGMVAHGTHANLKGSCRKVKSTK